MKDQDGNSQVEMADALWRACKLRCPHCGESKLFARYLKVVDVCPSCDVTWSDYPADDGPAWLTILVVGHIVASIAVAMAMGSDWPSWLIISVLVVASLVLTLAMLPFAKAAFVAVIWKTGAGAHK